MFDIQGHRGARALFPENTLEGFQAAATLGVTAFELDARLTRDGVVVLSHDAALHPDLTRDALGRWLPASGPLIRSLSYAELASYDVGRLCPGSPTASLFPDQKPIDGARIPTLAAVLAALPAARFTIEIKSDPRHPGQAAPAAVLADSVLAVVDEAQAAHRVMIESFDWRIQHHIRRSRPEIRLAWLTSAETAGDPVTWWGKMPAAASVAACVAAEGGPVWAPDFQTLTRKAIQEAHELGLQVLPWTVNQADDIQRLMEWGVDGLISDRPDLALEITGRAMP